MNIPGNDASNGSGSAGKRLRIAVLNRTFSTAGGGAERYSVALVEQLAAAHDMHVFAQEIAHQWPGVTYHRVSMPLRKPRWINQWWFASCTWWATRQGFDVVHSHENTWHGDVQTVHVLPVKHTLFTERQGFRRALRWVKVASSPRLLAYLLLERLRFSPRTGRQVVVTSDALRSVMASVYPECGSRVSVITPGIHVPVLPVTQVRRTTARAALGLPQDMKCILFVANDYRKKGLGTLLKALARCPEDVMLAVVGTGSQLASFTDVSKTLGLASRVAFLGSLKNVAQAYEAADCLAHPTLEDTFAMVVLEAMSYGLPVIVSGPGYCGISSLLDHDANALVLADPQDPAELHRALEQALDPAGLSVQLRQGALEFSKQYEWAGIARQQEMLYRDVVTARQGVITLHGCET